MGSDEARQELVTGDIVFAKTAAGPSGSEEWTEVGLVIRPQDVGAAHVEKPVVFTADGALGELWSTVRADVGNELAVVPGQDSGNPALLAHVRDAVVSVQATAVDPAGAAVLAMFRRDQPTSGRVVDAHLGFQRLIEVAGPGGFNGDVAKLHCGLCGGDAPCYQHG